MCERKYSIRNVAFLFFFLTGASAASKGKRAPRLFNPEPLCQCHTVVEGTAKNICLE